MEKASKEKIKEMIEQQAGERVKKHADFHAGNIMERFEQPIEEVFVEDLLILNNRMYYSIYNF